MQIEVIDGDILANWAYWEHKQRALDLQEEISIVIVEEDGSWEKIEEQATVEAEKGNLYVM